MKQTAVEWLVQWLKDNTISYGNSYDKAIDQAKEMEKEQVIGAWDDGFVERQFSIESNFEQYYNETFKSE